MPIYFWILFLFAINHKKVGFISRPFKLLIAWFEPFFTQPSLTDFEQENVLLFFSNRSPKRPTAIAYQSFAKLLYEESSRVNSKLLPMIQNKHPNQKYTKSSFGEYLIILIRRNQHWLKAGDPCQLENWRS